MNVRIPRAVQDGLHRVRFQSRKELQVRILSNLRHRLLVCRLEDRLDEEGPQRDPTTIHPSHPGIKGFCILGLFIQAIPGSHGALLLIKCTVFEGGSFVFLALFFILFSHFSVLFAELLRFKQFKINI